MVAPKGPGHIVRRMYEEGSGVPSPGGRVPGLHRQGPGHRPGLRQGPGSDPRRRDRDHLRGGDRDRPLRRAVRALRRRHRAGPRRFRHPGRGGLSAGDRLLRVPARAEAHRGPHLREAASPTCATPSATPPSTATSRAARRIITEETREEMRDILEEISEREVRAASGSWRTRRGGRSTTPCAAGTRIWKITLLDGIKFFERPKNPP